MIDFRKQFNCSYFWQGKSLFLNHDDWNVYIPRAASMKDEDIIKETKRQIAQFKRISKGIAVLMEDFGGSGKGYRRKHEENTPKSV